MAFWLAVKENHATLPSPRTLDPASRFVVRIEAFDSPNINAYISKLACVHLLYQRERRRRTGAKLESGISTT
jgi:hypothetical protein